MFAADFRVVGQTAAEGEVASARTEFTSRSRRGSRAPNSGLAAPPPKRGHRLRGRRVARRDRRGTGACIRARRRGEPEAGHLRALVKGGLALGCEHGGRCPGQRANDGQLGSRSAPRPLQRPTASSIFRSPSSFVATVPAAPAPPRDRYRGTIGHCAGRPSPLNGSVVSRKPDEHR